MPEYSITKRCIGGIAIRIVGLEELIKNKHQLSVGVLFVLHGRDESANEPYLYRIANAAIDEADGKILQSRQRDLLVVIFDQRNHGARMIEKKRNKEWKETGSIRIVNGEVDPQSLDNISYIQDMYTTYTGTANDVSFLISHLPSSIFPNGERVIDKWMVTGFSLGAHATWHVGAHDPRVTVLIPASGTPTYLTYIKHRATAVGIPLSPPYLPKFLEQEIERTQPQVNHFKGKNILVLAGGDDKTVDFEDSGCKAFLFGRLGPATVCKTLERVLQPNTGHVFTEEMVSQVKYFVWEHAIDWPDWKYGGPGIWEQPRTK